MPGFGTVWFDQDAIANIFGLNQLKKLARVTYDSDVKDAFLVHKPEGISSSLRRAQKDFIITIPSDKFRAECQNGTSHLTSVEENKLGYTQPRV